MEASIYIELAYQHLRRNPAEPRTLAELATFYLELPHTPEYRAAVRAMGPVKAVVVFSEGAQRIAEEAIAKAAASSWIAVRGDKTAK